MSSIRNVIVKWMFLIRHCFFLLTLFFVTSHILFDLSVILSHEINVTRHRDREIPTKEKYVSLPNSNLYALFPSGQGKTVSNKVYI